MNTRGRSVGSVVHAFCLDTVSTWFASAHSWVHSCSPVSTKAGTCSMRTAAYPHDHAINGIIASGMLRVSFHLRSWPAGDQPWQGGPAISMWAEFATVGHNDMFVTSIVVTGVLG